MTENVSRLPKFSMLHQTPGNVGKCFTELFMSKQIKLMSTRDWFRKDDWGMILKWTKILFLCFFLPFWILLGFKNEVLRGLEFYKYADTKMGMFVIEWHLIVISRLHHFLWVHLGIWAFDLLTSNELIVKKR